MTEHPTSCHCTQALPSPCKVGNYSSAIFSKMAFCLSTTEVPASDLRKHDHAWPFCFHIVAQLFLFMMPTAVVYKGFAHPESPIEFMNSFWTTVYYL